MVILITGGAGFIGSNLASHFLNEGKHVRVYDNLATGKRSNLHPDLEFIAGDVRDANAVKRAMKEVTHVFHLAALTSVPESFKERDLYHYVNYNGTLNVMRAALAHKVERIIFSSSAAVYGDTIEEVQREGEEGKTKSPYATSKYAGEQLLQSTKEIETVCLRYFNVFGPRQDLNSGYAAVIPKFIKALLNNEQPVVYGTGQQSRDFVSVDNVVHANALAMKAKNVSREIINIATGQPTSVIELAALLSSITGTPFNPRYEPAREGDILHSCADITKARTLLDYNPDTNLRGALERTVEYYKK